MRAAQRVRFRNRGSPPAFAPVILLAAFMDIRLLESCEKIAQGSESVLCLFLQFWPWAPIVINESVLSFGDLARNNQ
jgi:hypothetical protein